MDVLLKDVIQITREAGAEIMKYYRSEYRTTEKAPDNPVTDADYAADDILYRGLTAALPAAGWLSEESVDRPERLQKERVWIVDPLDGTKEFIKGLSEFAVSVALVEGGRPVLGVVYNPATDEMFYGAHGEGIFFNDAPAAVTRRRRLEGAQVAASRSEFNRGEFDPFKDRLQIQIVGSTAYKMARVASGLCDAAWSRGPKNEWDICAGVLLVMEAGGRCVSLEDLSFTFNRPETLVSGFIADNGALHNALVRMLAPFGAART